MRTGSSQERPCKIITFLDARIIHSPFPIFAPGLICPREGFARFPVRSHNAKPLPGGPYLRMPEQRIAPDIMGTGEAVWLPMMILDGRAGTVCGFLPQSHSAGGSGGSQPPGRSLHGFSGTLTFSARRWGTRSVGRADTSPGVAPPDPRA